MVVSRVRAGGWYERVVRRGFWVMVIMGKEMVAYVSLKVRVRLDVYC